MKKEEINPRIKMLESITGSVISSYVALHYLESLKRGLLEKGNYTINPETGMLPFESMDKTNIVDEAWFTGDILTKKGKEIVATIEKYKADIKSILGPDIKYKKSIEKLDRLFSTDDVIDNEGTKKPWLDYHFKGFPIIASYTKLTAMQSDIKATETNLFNNFLGNVMVDAVSLNKYKAIVLADKSAFFAGEKFQGKVVIGKYANVPPTKLVVQGNEIDLSKAIDSTGAARLDFNVGNVGEHKINGEFTFLEDGKELKIPIVDANYVVIPRPNSATISADKMNVVYRGVANPMTISFAGVPDNKVNASANGLSKVAGQGKYIMNAGPGREVIINVSATLDDGSKASDSKTFRIKDIPAPTGIISGQFGVVKLPKRNIEIGTIGAVLQDFVFDLNIEVTTFKIKVPGQPTVSVSGTKMNSQAKAAIRRARVGENITIFDIKARISNNKSYRLKNVSPVVVEVSN